MWLLQTPASASGLKCTDSSQTDVAAETAGAGRAVWKEPGQACSLCVGTFGPQSSRGGSQRAEKGSGVMGSLVWPCQQPAVECGGVCGEGHSQLQHPGALGCRQPLWCHPSIPLFSSPGQTCHVLSAGPFGSGSMVTVAREAGPAITPRHLRTRWEKGQRNHREVKPGSERRPGA